MSEGATTLTVGSILACFYHNKPQLCKLINVSNGNDVEIEWMVGSYSEPWKIQKQKRCNMEK